MDTKEIKDKWYKITGEKVVESLNRRHFKAFYCETKEEAISKIFSLIPKTDIVSWGGSMTLESLGIQKKLIKDGYSVIDRDSAKDFEEKRDLTKKALLADTFLLSSNAVTEDGQLFNIDGTGNRLAALVYGPRNVIVVAGMNKVVHSLQDAISRVRNIAAPANHQRFPGKTPCTQNGVCGDCISEDCICAQMVATRISRPAERIKVILIGEDLGL